MIDASCLPVTEDVAWIPVEDSSAHGRARRAATALANRLGFSDTRAAEVGLAVTELGTNLHKHASAGVLVVRAIRGHTESAVEVVALDSGPGIADLSVARRDGQSSVGTLGVGLGAVTRLADVSEVQSELGRGTVVAARFHPARGPLPALPVGGAAGLTRPIGGEQVCGDAYAVRRMDGGRIRLMMCDGSGHGPLAASASNVAVRVFCENDSGGPEDVVGLLHTALRGTRGGAVAVADLDLERETVRFAGLGNIAACVVWDGHKRGMVSVPGIAGYQARTIRAFDHELPAGATVVLHSDGLTERWTPEGRDALFRGSPLVVAAALLRDAGVRKDDAGVLVCGPSRP
jgi:anti-sigma regulatory factor (Ser/Thr protein kinase)